METVKRVILGCLIGASVSIGVIFIAIYPTIVIIEQSFFIDYEAFLVMGGVLTWLLFISGGVISILTYYK